MATLRRLNEGAAIATEVGPPTPDDTDPSDSEEEAGGVAPEGVIEGEEEEDDGEEAEEEEGEEEELDPFRDTDPTILHLRNINSLASWHVSTHKPHCSIPALLSPTSATYWQSDGPQPHTLSIHFFKMVHIVKMRILLDWKRDESYTPTKMQFWAGTGGHDLCCFGEWEGERPNGWVDVGIPGEGKKGGGLRCFLVEVRVLENHQNGKDTHVRGVQVFSQGEGGGGGRGALDEEDQEEEEMMVGDEKGQRVQEAVGRLPKKSLFDLKGLGGLDEPDWMKEPTLR
ncbi:MAG: hypothetical protein Q9220_004294 [cf. Caloplaca sp. 1 TL-2023]